MNKQEALDKKAENARELGLDYEPAAWMYPDDLKRFETSEAYADAYSIAMVSPDQGETVPLYREPPRRKPQGWSVFNTGAEVASGLSFEEAWDYLTPERLDRGWSAVCVVNKNNLPREAS
jgi:hypothetical protein